MRFLLGMIIGVSAGLVYGWILEPVEYVDTSPDSLRADYRADYVLMVAEVYGEERDLDRARQRLASLGPLPPVEIAAGALDYAEAHAFAASDLDRLRRLFVDLRRAASAPELGSP